MYARMFAHMHCVSQSLPKTQKKKNRTWHLPGCLCA